MEMDGVDSWRGGGISKTIRNIKTETETEWDRYFYIISLHIPSTKSINSVFVIFLSFFFLPRLLTKKIRFEVKEIWAPLGR